MLEGGVAGVCGVSLVSSARIVVFFPFVHVPVSPQV